MEELKMKLNWICLFVVFAAITYDDARAQTEVAVIAVAYDANTQTLSLTFSEDVTINDVACQDYAGFILQDDATNPGPIMASLDSGDDVVECSLQTDPGAVVDFRIVYYDLYNMTGLFESAANAALAWDENLFLDPAVYTLAAGALDVTIFTYDTTGPTLTAFELDLNLGALTLSFGDAPVDTSTVNFEYFTLSNGDYDYYYTIHGSINSPRYSNVLVFFLDVYALSNIATSSVCNDTASCFAYYDADFIFDPYGNPASPRTSDNALQVTVLVIDVTAPELLGFHFDLYGHKLQMTFSENVDPYSANISAITFSDTAMGTTSVSLTGGYAYHGRSYNVVDAYFYDFYSLQTAGICQSITTCYISFTSRMISDYSGNEVIAIPIDSAQQAQSFSPVNVTAVTYDTVDRSLVLTFSGPVDIDLEQCKYYSGFVLQNSVDNPTIFHQLYYNSIQMCDLSVDKTQITYYISDYENYTRSGLFVSADTAVLSWDDYIFSYYYSSSFYAIPGTLAVTYLNPDTSSPVLVSFDLDLDNGMLIITFDSHIDPYSVDFTEVSLSNGADETVPISGVISLRFNTILQVNFTKDSTATIAMSSVCESADTCHLSYSAQFISDPYGRNNVIDTTPPVLEQFSVNMYGSNPSLSLTFSEAVDPTTFEPLNLEFSDANNLLNSYTLTSAGYMAPSYDVIYILFVEDDLVLGLGDKRICQSIQTCFLSFPSDTISDYNLNLVEELTAQRASYYEFTSGGVEIEGVIFDHYLQLLYLNLSQPVDPSSLNCDSTLFTFENHLNSPTTFTPSYPGICNHKGSATFTFRLDERDYINMIKLSEFWRESSLSYLRWSESLLPNLSRGVRQVNTLYTDTQTPYPESFYIDFNNGVLTILFSSLVDPRTWDFSRLRLQTEHYDSYESYQLTGGTLLSSECGNATCFQMTQTDLEYIKNSSICNTTDSCHLYINNDAISTPFSNLTYSQRVSARRLDGLNADATGGLGVSLQYLGGCSRDIYLLPDEPLLLQTYFGEKVFRVWCPDDQRLGWKSGGLENITSPFNGESQSSISFIDGLNPHHFGVFVCSSETDFTQNFIYGNYWPFLESPDGKIVNVVLYSPLKYSIHFWPENLVKEIEVFDRNGTDIEVDITIGNYSAVISVDGSDVDQSISGNYTIRAITDYYYYYNYHELNVIVTVRDVVIEPSKTEVLIARSQMTLSLNCTPNNPLLPVVWREGQKSLSGSTPGVSLAPPTYNHQLTIDLDTYSLSGEDIVCEIKHPDNQQTVLAYATIQISLPQEGVEQCAEEIDSVWGILWDTTNEGSAVEQDCPGEGVVGIARRMCMEGGRWGDPDLSTCESEAFANLQDKIQEGLNDNDTDKRAMIISEVLSDLESAVSDEDSDTTIFPRDLITANNILKEVVDQLIEDTQRVNHTLQTDAVGVIDKMLDKTREEAWKAVTVFDNNDASLLLQVSENFGEYIALVIESDSIDTNDNIVLTEDNIEVRAEKLNSRAYSDVVYPEDGVEGSDRAQIKIPADHLSSRSATAVVNMRIKNIQNFLPEDEKGVPVAEVISSQLIGNEESSLASTPIQLIFTTTPTRYAKNPRCVYWGFEERQWLEDGVVVVEVVVLKNYSYKVTCESSHLTSFSVLVDIVEEEGKFEFTVDGYVGVGVLTGCALISSLLYSLSLIICCCGEYKTLNVLHLAHLGLSLSLLCVGVLFLAGLTLATENTVACTAVAGLLQYFFTASFTWISIIVVLVTVVVITAKPDSLSWKWTLGSILFGLLLPAIPTAISVGVLVDDYGNNAFCWIENDVDEMALWANVIPMAVISLITLLLVVLGLVFVCVRGRQYTELSFPGSLIILLSAAVVMVLVGGSWSTGVVMVNGNWDPAHWLFLACNCALGLTSLIESVLIVCFSTKCCNIITTADVKEKEDTQYWKDKKPLIREASGLQTGYEMRTTGGRDSAYSAMGTGPSDEEMVAMMNEVPQQPIEEQVISNKGAITEEVVEETKQEQEL